MDVDALFDAAIASLSGRKFCIAYAPAIVPSKPGLYAIYAPEAVWTTLGVTSSVDDGPLYVGKSEDDLLGREVFTHFNATATRKPATGSSTVRRSFAALLRAELHLKSQARNPEKPADFASYGLVGDGDRNLTAWMAENLELAIWEKPAITDLALRDIETQVIRHWDPPVNIHKAPTSRHQLKALRALLAREARERANLAEVFNT
ncbi:GIY-YIG nuclease family protein [Homoserinimonas sp. A447]